MAQDQARHYIDLVVGVVILVSVVAVLTPTLVERLANLSSTLSANGVPFASLVSPTGIIGLLFGIGIFYALYRIFWGQSSGMSGGKKF